MSHTDEKPYVIDMGKHSFVLVMNRYINPKAFWVEIQKINGNDKCILSSNVNGIYHFEQI